ncbi:MAG: hypothetical protein EOP52_09910 [Sphingobacteriales bacterium]|nr:MAG: hypothetical protein EOP52_09910 [Sphingobacteriales bacterium]
MDLTEAGPDTCRVDDFYEVARKGKPIKAHCAGGAVFVALTGPKRFEEHWFRLIVHSKAIKECKTLSLAYLLEGGKFIGGSDKPYGCDLSTWQNERKTVVIRLIP